MQPQDEIIYHVVVQDWTKRSHAQNRKQWVCTLAAAEVISKDLALLPLSAL